MHRKKIEVECLKIQTGRRLELALGALTLAAIIGTVQGRRIALAVENVSFITLLVLIVIFVGMAWWRTGHVWRDGASVQWRLWLSLAGCMALTLAFVLPCIQFLFAFRPWLGSGWNYKMLMLEFGIAALLAGIFAARKVGFLLMLGGFLIALVGIVIPMPVL